MPRTLIPVNDSPTTEKTLQAVLANRTRLPKKLSLLHVVDDKLAYRMIPDFQLEMVREKARSSGQALLEKIAAPLIEAGFEIETLLELGSPRRIIPQVANEQGFELLIIGRRPGGGEIRDVLFGSVANYVLHNVACPVILI